jgi:hypothetical protein
MTPFAPTPDETCCPDAKDTRKQVKARERHMGNDECRRSKKRIEENSLWICGIGDRTGKTVPDSTSKLTGAIVH